MEKETKIDESARLAELVKNPNRIIYDDYMKFADVQNAKRYKLLTIGGIAVLVLGLGVFVGTVAVSLSLAATASKAIIAAVAIPGGLSSALMFGGGVSLTVEGYYKKNSESHAEYAEALKRLRKENVAGYKALRKAMKKYSKSEIFLKEKLERAQEDLAYESDSTVKDYEEVKKGEVPYSYLVVQTRLEIEAAKEMKRAATKLGKIQDRQKKITEKAERMEEKIEVKAKKIEVKAEEKTKTKKSKTKQVKAAAKKGKQKTEKDAKNNDTNSISL